MTPTKPSIFCPRTGRCVDSATAPSPGELVLLGQAEIVGLGGEGDRVGAEQDPEESVEVAADLGDERGHVRNAQRDAGGAHDLAAVLLDLLDVGVAGGLPPRVVEEHDVPLLRQLAGQVRREGHRLGRRVVEGPEGVPIALGRGDRGVEAHPDHVRELVFLEHRHAGDAHVREVAALGHVDLVLDDQLFRLSPPDVRLGLIVGDDQLDRSSIDPAGLVDAVHGHLGADQRCLAAGGRHARQRLERAHLVGLGLAERALPRGGHQHRGPESACGRRAESEQPAAGDLAAVPERLRPLLVDPVLRHGEVPPCEPWSCRSVDHGVSRDGFRSR